VPLGVFADPPVVDQPDRDRVEEVQFLPPGAAGDDEVRLLQQAQMLHHADARHVHLSLELAEGPALALEEKVEKETTGGVGKRLEYAVVVVHTTQHR